MDVITKMLYALSFIVALPFLVILCVASIIFDQLIQHEYKRMGIDLPPKKKIRNMVVDILKPR